MEDGSMEFQVEMMSEEKGVFFNQPIHVELKRLGSYECATALTRVIDVDQVESLLFIKSYPEEEQALTGPGQTASLSQ